MLKILAHVTAILLLVLFMSNSHQKCVKVDEVANYFGDISWSNVYFGQLSHIHTYINIKHDVKFSDMVAIYLISNYFDFKINKFLEISQYIK